MYRGIRGLALVIIALLGVPQHEVLGITPYSWHYLGNEEYCKLHLGLRRVTNSIVIVSGVFNL
jgi:hypothetical protein